jgi:outer membrane receptor protein involved in Fe transport
MRAELSHPHRWPHDDLSANITNLANRKYWTYYQETYLNVGAPRTLNLNVRADF